MGQASKTHLEIKEKEYYSLIGILQKEYSPNMNPFLKVGFKEIIIELRNKGMMLTEIQELVQEYFHNGT